MAPATWRAGDLSSITTTHPGPATGVAFRRQPDSGSAASARSPRAILNNTALYPLPNRSRDAASPATTSARMLTTIDANQGDVRVDWSAVDQRQDLRTLLVRRVRVTRQTSARFRCSSGASATAPFRNLALNWNRIVSPTLVNELLVGYNQITIVSDTLDWAGIGDAQRDVRDRRRPADRRVSARSAGAADSPSSAPARATPDTLDKTYQINEKLTWLKGRHTLKIGGQLLHYVQQRFYAGNNGLLGHLRLRRRVHRIRRSPTSCSIRCRARAAAASRRRGRTCTTASRSTSRTTSR